MRRTQSPKGVNLSKESLARRAQDYRERALEAEKTIERLKVILNGYRILLALTRKLHLAPHQPESVLHEMRKVGAGLKRREEAWKLQ